MSKAQRFTVDDLQSRIRSIDEVSQGGLSQIGALAKVALNALETEAGSIDFESMARVLTCIIEKAHETENSINGMAEDAGCNYVDAAYGRRIDARAAAARMRGKA